MARTNVNVVPLSRMDERFDPEELSLSVTRLGVELARADSTEAVLAIDPERQGVVV